MSEMNFAALQAQEQELTLSAFSAKEALTLGLLVEEEAAKYPQPIAVEITLNGLVVFRYFQEGARPDSELWLERKRNAVELMHMSSLGFGKLLEESGETLEGRKLEPNDYAPGGGGFPIRVKGCGVIGSVCVSGEDNHLDDHAIVVQALRRFLAET